MIEVVIKRDGSKEDFSATKLNKWAEWAAKSLGGYVDWSSVAMTAVSTLPKECTSTQLQERLIKVCLDNNSWSYYKMAGRLYAALLSKTIYPEGVPTVKDLHSKLTDLGFMLKLDYSDEEYKLIEGLVDHSLDYKAAHFELHHIREKYSIKNRVTGVEYETQQFVYIRMAMAAAETEPKDERLHHVSRWYYFFNRKIINCPTPDYVNLGTPLKGYASCCTYTTNDNAKSLAIGDHIAYTMTCMSAGIGSHIKCRSIGDPVRGGVIEHQGKLPYLRAVDKAVAANLQNGRGGACTEYFTWTDPEVMTLLNLKNPRTPEDKKIRGLDYNFGTNKFFARKALRGEDVFTFSYLNAPDLYEAQYDKDPSLFEKLYLKYEADTSFKKEYVKARELILTSLTEAEATGRSYLHWTDELNHHTPLKEKIYSLNLCVEFASHTSGYNDMMDLYSTEDHGRGEIGLCSLAAINVANVKDDEEYAEACYYALKLKDKCIAMSDYALPHLGVTAKGRMNTGIGIVGLAYHLAKNHQSYYTKEGKNFIHEVAETHAWHVYNASLRIAKERGVAPWMHKTNWPEGWLPLDTYNKNVDSIVSVENKRDWEWLRSEIIKTGGIGHSLCINFMPAEASSKASGTTNGLYPIRDFTLVKTDDTSTVYWAAPEGEKLAKWYEMAWDIPTKDMIDVYAIFQKWSDQSISADLYRKVIGDTTVSSSTMLDEYFYMTKMGTKSRYYQVSKTSEGLDAGCGSGGCSI
jgi:ribonucleoside-diphosphate reductase alpha chain